ncbi:hypothetical protein THAOC_05256 [Thalassiosira oceanica]|uniref:Uncharacterized protein n=1 Tax=Thalassiosira oceanica TaxID=159749 RepID=K0T7S9_THAOC|nr:hypothetical protein THAOC_05256 [Thalassiosira oceanica]|eukprot:EJK73139.1 hypothetical protein THAOC_05256 [Thalassiosira oceanica]
MTGQPFLPPAQRWWRHAPLLLALPSDNCGGSKDSGDLDSSNHYLREILDVNGKAGGERGDKVMATACRLGSGPIPTLARRACLCCLTLAARGAAALDPTQEGGEKPTALSWGCSPAPVGEGQLRRSSAPSAPHRRC